MPTTSIGSADRLRRLVDHLGDPADPDYLDRIRTLAGTDDTSRAFAYCLGRIVTEARDVLDTLTPPANHR